MTDWQANKNAVKALAVAGYLTVDKEISRERARELVAAGWARLHRDKKRLGITSAGRDVADRETARSNQ
jgi:hypothetical protein